MSHCGAYYDGRPFAPVSDAALHASRTFAGQCAVKLPQALSISTVVTESDMSRWEAVLDSETVHATQNDSPQDTMLPDLASAIVRQETASQISKLCPIPPFVPASMVSKPAAKQLVHRTKWLPYRQKVPAYQQRNTILAAVRDNRLVFVIGGAHSGKSTQIPQLLAETDLFRRKRIIVAASTPAQAILLARRLREEKGDAEPVIAHVTSTSSTAKESTHIVTCTYEVLFRTLIADAKLMDVGCVVLDDVAAHSDIYVDLCLSGLKELMGHPTANKDLRLVVNLRDDSADASLSQFLSHGTVKVERVIIPEPESQVPHVAMYLDDAYQWLEKISQTGRPFLVQDPNQELAEFSNHVQVLAKVLAHEDADLAKHPDGSVFVSYWIPLIEKLLTAFDSSDRSTLSEALSALCSVLIIVPTKAQCLLCKQHLERAVAEDSFQFVCVVPETVPSAVCALADELIANQQAGKRLVVIATPSETSSTTTILLKNIGCLIDTCTIERKGYDAAHEADRVSIDTTSKATMRAHRMLLRTNGPAMSLQLLTRQVLHSARTKLFPLHPATVLPLDALLDTVSFFQLRSHQQHNTGSISNKFVKLLSSKCWDVNPAQLRNETYQRLAVHAESILRHAGHMDGQLSLTALGSASLLFSLPLPIKRVLILGTLLSDMTVSTLAAALWSVGDIFYSWTADEAVQSREARSFFLMGSKSDFTVALNAYVMWRRTAVQAPEEEQEFLDTARLCKQKLVLVSEVHASLLAMLHQLKLTAAVPSQDDIDSIFTRTDETASVLDATTRMAISAALYPYVTYTDAQGAAALPRLAEASTPSCLQASTVATSISVSDSRNDLCVTLSRVADPLSTHVETGIQGPASLPSLVVFCGQGSRQELAASKRCRGWISPLTNTWRQTRAARHLPPPPQIQPRTIAVKPYNPVASDAVKLELDGIVQLKTSSQCAALLSRIRDFAKRRMVSLVTMHSVMHNSTTQNPVREALEWLLHRDMSKESYLRERRQAWQQQSAADRPQARQLHAYLTYNAFLERPTAAQFAAPVETVYAAGDTHGLHPAGVVEGGAVTSLTFTGKTPTDQALVALIRQTAQTIAKNANRDSEAGLLNSSPTVFGFLNPDNEYHEYYLYILKKEAPHLDWLGDDIEELERWLQDLERTVEGEVAASAAVSDNNTAYTHQNYQNHDSEHANTNPFEAAYEEVSEEQYSAELRRQQDIADEERRRAEEARKMEQASKPVTTFEPPKPGSVLQFLSPQASAQGVGSGAVGGQSTLLQSLMAMRGTSAPSSIQQQQPSSTSPFLAPPVGTTDPAPAYPAATQQYTNLFAQPPSASPAPMFTAQDLLSLIGASGGPNSMAPPMYTAPPPRAHPLSIPPPPLPSEALACRTPSVIVSPLPNVTGMNLPLVLAKALGETLDLKVGPTTLVGDVARIEVPTQVVEMRALALKHFFCLGQKLTITKNDRIIDNPNGHSSRKIAGIKERLQGGRGGRGGVGGPSSFGRGGGGGGRGGYQQREQQQQPQPAQSFLSPSDASVPPVTQRYIQPPGHVGAANSSAPPPQPEGPAASSGRAGALTDSDEE